MLPRKNVQRRFIRSALEQVAYQIGTHLAIERNRNEWTQEELGERVGIPQEYLSMLENGQPFAYNDAVIDAIFTELGLPTDDERASFLKWWRDLPR